MLKVCLKPFVKDIAADNGIGRVVHAQYKYLPDHGIELVTDPLKADLCVGHTQKFDMPRIDLLLCHGLYWSDDPNSGNYDQWHSGVNWQIVQASREAYAITVPSRWVAKVFQRDMRLSPVVIGHGIDPQVWKAGKNGGYVFWGKNRATDVCDPTPAYELARAGAKVVSTFQPLQTAALETLTVTGKLTEKEMHKRLSAADVYLATTQETFGITTLEAMACGVPVLGWDWGGTRDLVTHKVNGYLVDPHDIGGLLTGLDYIRSHRAELSAAAIETANQYTWQNVIAQYAQLFQEVYEMKRTESRSASIVITNFNYAAHVCDAIDSALNQTTPPAEVIVVDDGSSDDSLARLAVYADDKRVKVIAQKNQGVAAARTAGIRAASQEYIACLDADDRIEPEFISTLLPPMLSDRSLGIAYSGLRIVYPSGDSAVQKEWPPEFSWEGQATPHNPPSNYIPSACLFRKEMWRRAGPHKQEYAPGEDAEFWTRGLSIGYNARRITPDPLFVYYAHAASASRTKVYRPIDDRLPFMRDRRWPLGAPLTEAMPAVRSYSQPLVSVIIPVGSGHARYLPDALDSLLGQTFREWEVIVVDDTYQKQGDKLRSEITAEIHRRYPFIEYRLSPARGSSPARNEGLKAAQAPLTLFLDADDVLLPNALHELVKAYRATNGRYVYSDIQMLNKEGAAEYRAANEYRQMIWADGGLHSVSALVPTDWLRNVGGFDESIIGWEDGELFSRLAIAGYCGVRVPKALLVYRAYSGGNRANNWQRRPELAEWMNQKYGTYMTGEKSMSTCCGGNPAALLLTKGYLDNMPEDKNSVTLSGVQAESNTVRMEFTGFQKGEVTFFGNAGREYQGAATPQFRFADVNPADVDKLAATGKWRKSVSIPIAEAAPEVRMSEITPDTMAMLRREAEKQIADEKIADEPKVEAVKVVEPVKAKTPAKSAARSKKSNAVGVTA